MTDTPAAPDPVTAAARELAEHKAACPHCRAERTRPGAPLCSRWHELIAAWRRVVREAAPRL
jgi:hypothetical protein